MNLSAEELDRMRDRNIMDLKREELVRIEDIVIDTEKSVESRVRSFIGQAGNPYAFKVGNYILQTGFAEGAADLIEDRVLLLAERKTQIMI